MLHLSIPGREFYNEKTNEFITVKPTELVLEHSLVSISKWESKWHIAFFEENNKSDDQIKDYIRCMTLTQNVDPMIYSCLTDEHIGKVMDYLNDPMTATTFSNVEQRRGPTKKITNEEIYYSMITLNIPMECQKWHINRLLTLIKVCSLKSAPQKKMSRSEILKNNKALNQARRAKLHSRG